MSSKTSPRPLLARKTAVASAMTIALATTAAAENARTEKDDNIDEIVVEAHRYQRKSSSAKFTAPLIDTPKSVVVIPTTLMAEQNATNLVQALRNVPGITFNAGEGGQPAGDNLRIRGFDAGADVFVDGVRDAGSQTRDVFALEQVEVVKGPGSAYSGRGSTGGTVNLVSKSARAENFVNASAGAGSDAYLRGTVDANHAFSDETAIRLNLLQHDADVPGRDAIDINHRGAAASLALGLGKPTRATVDYYHYRTDDMPDYSLPYSRNDDNTANAGAPVAVDRDNFYGLVNRDFQETGADIGTVTLEHDFRENLTLRNTTRHGESSNDYIVTNPDDSRANVANGYVLRNTKSRNSTTTTRANLTDLVGEFEAGGIAHSYAVGFEVSNEEMYNRNYSVEHIYNGNANSAFANSCSAPGAAGALSNYNCTTLDNPDPNDPWTGQISPSDNATLAETDTWSVYTFDTITLNEQWIVNVGLRYDDYRTQQRSGAIAAPTEVSNDSDFLNYQFGVVYKPSDNGSIYASTGTSSNPSGNTLGDGTENIGSNNADLEPEEDRTIELGVKWQFGNGQLALTSALFQTEKTNARVSVEPGRGGRQETVGEQRVNGFELSVTGQITENWQVFAGYTMLRSEILDGGPVSDDDGNDFPNTPRNSANLWTTVNLLPELKLGAGATYVDRRYGNTANTVWAPSYLTYDAMAAYQVSDMLSLQLNVQNLTDETYFVRPYANHYAALGPARSAVLSASFSF